MLKDFCKCILRGSIIDLLIGFTVAAAFTIVPRSFVQEVLMPIVGVFLGRTDFSNFFIVIKNGTNGASNYNSVAQAKAAGAVTINYGLFINNIISLLIVGLSVYLLVKLINKLNNE